MAKKGVVHRIEEGVAVVLLEEGQEVRFWYREFPWVSPGDAVYVELEEGEVRDLRVRQLDQE